eukprot:3089365-Prymnesium_polylepis.1
MVTFCIVAPAARKARTETRLRRRRRRQPQPAHANVLPASPLLPRRAASEAVDGHDPEGFAPAVP